MNRLIESEELLKELDSLYREEDCEIGDGGVVTSSWATVDYGEVIEKVNQASTIHAIPIDKVKAAREEISKASRDFYEELAQTFYNDAIKDAVEILDKLIAESEDKE